MISVPLRAAIGLTLTSLLLVSCGSSGTTRVRGVPRNLPRIDLQGSAETPPHAMARDDYPFDANGNYVTAWVSERGASGNSDYSSWQSSHGGSVSRRQPSPVRKVSSSSKKKTSSTSKGGTSYTIKRGDTLGAIARKHGTTVSKIKAANGMSSDFIREGKTLRIPR